MQWRQPLFAQHLCPLFLVCLWSFYLLFIPHSKIVGGKIIPLMTLGGLIGLCFVFNAKDNGLIHSDEHLLVIATAMFALFGVTFRKPLTAFALAITFSRWSVIPYQIIPFILAIVPGYLLMVFTKLSSLNECLELPNSFEKSIETD